ncbi:hypothetical protein GOBAR_AA33843 [Gossypium barbadense]|uniref:Uncharacterized protein n=1 Tax=Gossypium barbadense TaxID=3634 RepID=A0A2P5W704_GOSBA|nr:hypothetical protein GOBAR_AA33843 [Gossypium barbadense]
MKLSRVRNYTSSGTSSTINPTYPNTDYHQYVRQDDMEGMLLDAFNMHSHVEQSFPPDFIASDDCNIGGNVFCETETSAPNEELNEKVANYGKMNQPPNTQKKGRSRDESDDESDEQNDPNEADFIVQNTPNSEKANSEQQTVVGSSNVPETLDKPAEFQTESGGTRRGRGPTLLKDLYDLNPVERVKVSRNSHG